MTAAENDDGDDAGTAGAPAMRPPFSLQRLASKRIEQSTFLSEPSDEDLIYEIIERDIVSLLFYLENGYSIECTNGVYILFFEKDELGKFDSLQEALDAYDEHMNPRPIKPAGV